MLHPMYIFCKWLYIYIYVCVCVCMCVCVRVIYKNFFFIQVITIDSHKRLY